MHVSHGRQRNITPNFLRFKRKSEEGHDKVEPIVTDRSASRASKCSLEAYEKRILHMSKLKNYVFQQESATKRTNYLAETVKSKLRVISSEKPTETSQRENTGTFLLRVENKKRNSASGKILLKPTRTPSNQKRTEQSLEKEEERARAANAELLQNMMRNQVPPNYIHKIKMKKTQPNKKIVSKLKLNLKVQLKPEEELRKYQIFGELGKGAYGLVRMGVNRRNNDKIAIKIYQKKRIDEPNKVKNLQRQINILAQLSHTVIARLIEAIETPNQIYIILEYGGANSLYNYLLSKEEHRLEEQQAKMFLLTIAEALQYLHKKEIVHRDIKAQNILINRFKELKLIDFGFSLHCAKNETIDTFCGTPTYMAPEIVSKVDHCPIYTDMWSLGILFYVMLQGNYPFRAKNQRELFEKIKQGRFEYIYPNISQEAKHLIESLLKVDPLQRITIDQLLKLRPWLKS